jgi:RNA polymerase sigma-70 factor (ECF subfamily)
VVRIPVASETELIKRARQGDADAFGLLVETHAEFVRRLTRAVLRDRDDADDAAQEAFFSAWRSRERFDPGRPFKPWLGQIAINAARDYVRRRTVRRTEAIPETLAGRGATPAAAAEQADLRKRLGAALDELPERQRLALVLFEVEGYAHAEIGLVLGIPEGTARSEVFHARRKLRMALGEQEERT